MRRQAEIAADAGARWLAAMKRHLPRRARRRPHHRRAAAGRRRALLRQRRACSGELRDAEFARLFFGIWLSPRTSEPALREALLGPGRPMTTLAAPRGWQGGWAQGLRYGGLGLPLAFVALPLYVILPNHYASEFGVPLATLGALLLGARLLDAVADPWIGRSVDGWFAHSLARVLAVALAAALVLAAGFRGLFFPAGAGHARRCWRGAPRCWP